MNAVTLLHSTVLSFPLSGWALATGPVIKVDDIHYPH
jgi:hypothetical protein